MSTIEQLKQRVNDAVKESGLAPELDKQFRVLVQAVISRLDLVPREEFDAQAKVLQQTRRRLEELEREVDQLLQAAPDKDK
jgi:ubiquinone biosynthesis accessory factor UbiK